MTGNLKLGLTPINFGSNGNPENMARIAQSAEKAGFDSVWVGGHPFLSERQTRIPPTTRMLDPLVSLAFVAAHTRKIRLGTGILLLPQFNPVILAKQLASIDVLSNGRLIVGIGVGWSEHEYEVLRIPFGTRGRTADEYLRAMEVLWNEDKPVYHGQFVSFDEVQSYPHTAQSPHPPIVVGGLSEGSYRRAVEQGNGWYGYALDLEGARSAIAGLRDAARKYQRRPELGELEVSVAPSVPVDRAAAEQFSELGVDRLILILPQNEDVSKVERFVETAGSTLLGQG